MRVDEHTVELAAGPAHFLRAVPDDEREAGATPVYLHGVPTNGADWAELLERTGGLAPDLLGFGRSAKGGHLRYSVPALADFLEGLLDHLGIDTIRLAAHQWGAAVALELAARRPERVQRLALVQPLPLGHPEQQPRPARLWRRPLLGELVMGATTKTVFTRALRRAGLPPARAADAWQDFDQGTQRAILRLHRAPPPARLELRPHHPETLVLYGDRDPWLDAAAMAEVCAALAVAPVVTPAGHWPWLESDEAADTLVSFLR